MTEEHDFREMDQSSDEESSDPLVERLSRRIRRKERSRERGERRVWFGLGMFGLVGWSVALPTLAGLLLGVWIDGTFESGRSWTLILLIAGITVGCFNAWYWVRDELDRGALAESDEEEEQ